MFDKQMLKNFFNWIRCREQARIGHDAGAKKPWTKDPVIQKYRFCNVRRMDDKVSQWLFANWYPKSGVSDHTLLIAACLARLINWPDTLDFMTGSHTFTGWKADTIAKMLHAWKAKGKKVFTGAYIINGAAGGSKIDQVVRNIQKIHEYDLHTPLIVAKNMQSSVENLMQMPGMGSFIAGQVVADLRHTPAMRNPPDDVMTWAPIGPGSRRGMSRLIWQDPSPKRKLTVKEFEMRLPFVIEQVSMHCPKIFEDRKLEAMDIQNCLCEFDKYMRVINGEGTPRSLYDGITNQGKLI